MDASASSFFEMVLPADGAASFSMPVLSVPKPENHLPWPEEDGQLTVDVMDTMDEVVVISPMAGTVPDTIHVLIHNDVLTIRGVRQSPLAHHTAAHALHQECFWGSFSRTIILPVPVRPDGARAEYRHGVLMIYIPKRHKHAEIPVMIVEE